MSFNIEFDYRFDTMGFFTPQARAGLEVAASIWENLIKDEFPDFRAGQPFQITNPETGDLVTVTLTNDIDDLLIFVGSRDLSGMNALARGGPDGYNADGDINRMRFADNFRDQGATTDFEPFTGKIYFDREVDWGFRLDEPEAGKSDFISTALHEIGHVLGIGPSSTYEKLIENGVFVGPNAKAVTNGVGIALEPVYNHIAEGLDGGPAVMDTFNRLGVRTLPTDLDKAILADIGYEIDGFSKQGSPFALATEMGETIFGSALGDVINGLGGDDDLVGLGGADHLRGGPGANKLFGGAGADRYYFGQGDGQSRLNDFDFVNEKIVIDPAFGFTSAADVLALVSNPFSNVSEINLPGDASAYVFHNESGSALLAQNIIFGVLPDAGGGDGSGGSSDADILVGDGSDNLFVGGAGDDIIDGSDGIDTAQYSGNQRSYTLSLSEGGTTLVDRRADGNGTDTLANIEFLSFDDGINAGQFNLSIVDGSAGLTGDDMKSVIELYIAYFNRAPDAVGLNYWGTEISKGYSLSEMAKSFFVQDETRKTYEAVLDGSGNLTDIPAFVTSVYGNVLGRAADQEGFEYWVGELQSNPDITPGNFILAIINGAKNPTVPTAQTAVDQQYLENKTDVGAYYAVIKGMTDADVAAKAVMSFYDGTQDGINAAMRATDDLYAAALDADTGAFLMPLVGVIDAPFFMA